MGVDSVWVVLEPKAWVDDTWEKKLLGVVVRDFYTPTNRKPDDPSRYHPNENGIITREFTDFVLNNEASSDTNIEARLTVLLGAKVINTSSIKVDLSAKTVRLRRLDQDEDYWEKLREDLSLKRVLPTWIKKAGKRGFPDVCLVVGIAICEDVEIEWDKKRIAKREADGQFPLDVVITVAAGSILPVPVGSNIEATVAKEKTQVYVFKAKQAKKSIFALELKVIEREGWIETRTILGRGPAVEQGHELGDNDDDDDDDDEVEVADLVLHELRSIPVKPKSGTEDGTDEK
jgi:hypothetical protein